MASYHALWFLASFFIFIVIAFVLILPLTILQIVKLFRPVRAPGIVKILIGLCTAFACISFGCALIIVSVFSYYPYYAAALLITLFLILIFLAFKPWKPGFFKNKSNFYLIIVLVFMFIMSWIIAAVTRDICIASNPYSVTVYQTRKLKGDSCADFSPRPCHVYFTFGANASTSVIVHYHSTTDYDNPIVKYSIDGSLNLTANATRYKMDLEVPRYVYYAEINDLLPSTSYQFVAGDLSNNKSFSAAKFVRSAPLSGPFSFISGGDVGLESYAPILLKAAASHEPLYIAIGGDIAYENAMSSCYGRWDDWFNMYEKYAITPSGYSLPIVAAVGNHEAGGFYRPMSSLRFYTRYFVQEALNGRKPEQLPSYHAHQISNQLLISLDSEVIATAASQVSWLNTTLAAAPAGSFKTAIYHAPGYPAYRPIDEPNSKAIRTHFVPVFDEHQLAVSFENHDHVYKRTHRIKGGAADVNGTLYVGDGAMGVRSREPPHVLDIPSDRPYLQQWQGRSFYLLVNVTDSDYSIAAIDQNAFQFDSFNNAYP